MSHPESSSRGAAHSVDQAYDAHSDELRPDYPQRKQPQCLVLLTRRSLCEPRSEPQSAYTQDNCRRHKIKCVDKENPPCKRCRHMRLQCKFAMPPMPRQVVEETEATKRCVCGSAAR